MYPPLAAVNSQSATQTLVNGTQVQSPLGGTQYVTLHGEDTNSPDTIWIKGADTCPAVTKAQATFENSTEFKDNVAKTKAFYAGFWDIMQNVYDYTEAKLTYAKAFDIFDLINTASTQNRTIIRNVTSDDLFQLRTLADSAEFGYNFNSSMPARSIGGRTMAGGLFMQLNQTVASQGKLKFSLLAGSYNTALSFFGLMNLTAASPDFFGLPVYASTHTFELFTTETTSSFPTDLSTLNIRYLFKNGTGAAFTAFPLFGRSEDSIPWPQFVVEMQSRAITTVKAWCQACGNSDGFCLQYASSNNASVTSSSSSASKGGMSNAVAGVISALVTLGVLAIVGALAFVLLRRRKSNANGVPVERKVSVGSSGASA
jgi:prostatic aicd phosphatase